MEQLKSFLKLLLPPALSALVAGFSPNEVVANFATLTGIFTMVPIFVEPIKTFFKTEGWITRIISWLVSFALVYLSFWLGWGFTDYTTFSLILTGFLLGVASNGWFTIEQVKMLLSIMVTAPPESEEED